ncbi:PLP-dependent aminotransferase family protein [Cellvibrio sp. pealriver]|uniref:MocR-like pyridoxine biosynthesis transcription factor PdxR n=1 Tax=Cellvibrio sp. pealriver TaxID=1622269 RepID=UPI00066FED1A|nr:PLP-dependent aminotransferase family protein [Cellvibrio sp. pealriver]
MDYQLLFHEYEQRYSLQTTAVRQSRQRRLYNCLREAILQGRIPAGAKLPGSRSLAAELHIARNSVLYAYEQLVTEGLLRTLGGSTRVSQTTRVPGGEPGNTVGAANIAPLPVSMRARLTPWPSDPQGTYTAFVAGVPSLPDFPIPIWRRCLDRAWRGLSYQQLDYSDASGEPLLRQAIAEHLTSTRGVRCTAEQIFITDGTQQSLSICAHACANAGDNVWVENPGYGGAFQTLKAAELTVIGIAVDQHGIAPQESDWRQHPPKLIYTTPSHQFPLGSVMSIERRLALIEAAQRVGALIVEDDYDSEFRRDGPPLPAMQGLVEDAPVIYLGTFSKTVFPALRIGFMVVPTGLVEAFCNLLRLGHLRGRSAEQLALAEFLRGGYFANHLKKMRRLYAARRDALVAALEKYLGDSVTIYGGSSGIHLTIALQEGYDDEQISKAALAQGIYVQPLSKLATGKVLHKGLMLGYAQVREEDMDKYIRILTDVIKVNNSSVHGV